MQQMGLIKNFVAQGLIPMRCLVTVGADEGTVRICGDGESAIGTTAIRGAKDGQRIDVCLDQIREITFGGPVSYGDHLKSDGQGRAVRIEPGETAATIGMAMTGGRINTIGHVLIRPGVHSEPAV